MKKAQPIGIFDSGIGGLTVARSLKEALPLEQFIYFGDTLHMPYGDKSAEEIIAYSKNIVEFLISKNVKLIVIACNSASSIAAGKLRSDYWQQVEIMGVIRPVIKSIIEKKIRKIGIIGTSATIKSNIYPALLKEYKSDANIFQLATPLLAPKIEAGHTHDTEMHAILNEYLSNPNFEDTEAILLACTHYPLIRKEVDQFFGHKKMILDNAVPLAAEVKDYLTNKNLLASAQTAEDEFYVSKYSQTFEKTIATFYGRSIAVTEIQLPAK